MRSSKEFSSPTECERPPPDHDPSNTTFDNISVYDITRHYYLHTNQRFVGEEIIWRKCLYGSTQCGVEDTFRVGKAKRPNLEWWDTTFVKSGLCSPVGTAGDGRSKGTSQ